MRALTSKKSGTYLSWSTIEDSFGVHFTPFQAKFPVRFRPAPPGLFARCNLPRNHQQIGIVIQYAVRTNLANPFPQSDVNYGNPQEQEKSPKENVLGSARMYSTLHRTKESRLRPVEPVCFTYGDS
jgi:hypothetical protein